MVYALVLMGDVGKTNTFLYVSDDTVYMEDVSKRNEYVMNDEGFIARGSYYRISKKTWHYSQFDDGVLDSVLNMISNDTRFINQPVKSRKKCNDPVFVSRVLSAMVCIPRITYIVDD